MERDDVFFKEFQLLNDAKKIVCEENDKKIITESLKKMTIEYEKLLNNTSKITRISDKLYEKLATANELIENQKKDLIKINNELTEAQKIVRREVNKIVNIQQSLLPEKIPDNEDIKGAAYYCASVDAGGDYYDIIKINDGKYGVCIADVSGHGVHAAVIMAMTRMGVNICAFQNDSPAKFMEQLDNILIDNIKTGDFVSVFYGIIDVENNKFSFSNGGHPPFFYYNSFTKSVYEVNTGKGHLLGMGIFNQNGFQQDEIKINRGDILFFLTDGIVEARNNIKEMFGYERLRGVIERNIEGNIEATIKKIIEEIKKYTKKEEFYDDITIVGIKIN